MHAASEHCVVLCTCPDAATAERLGRALVEQKLAACVNLVPGLQSIYRWAGAIEQASEVLLIIKTRVDRLDTLEQAIRAAHPYTVPEMLTLPVASGHAPYLNWLSESLQ